MPDDASGEPSFALELPDLSRKYRLELLSAGGLSGTLAFTGLFLPFLLVPRGPSPDVVAGGVAVGALLAWAAWALLTPGTRRERALVEAAGVPTLRVDARGLEVPIGLLEGPGRAALLARGEASRRIAWDELRGWEELPDRRNGARASFLLTTCDGQELHLQRWPLAPRDAELSALVRARLDRDREEPGAGASPAPDADRGRRGRLGER